MSEQAQTGLAADDESAVESYDESTKSETEESEAPETDILADETGADEAEEDEDSDDQDATEDWAEVELNGQTYKVHPDLRDGYIHQSDYTKKTQEVAEQRRQVEARQSQLQEAAEVQMAHINELAAIQVADQQVTAFDQIDWDALYNQDPAEAARLSHQHQMARTAKAEAENQFQLAHQTALQAQQVELAKAQEQCRDVVQRDIAGWSKDVERDVTEYALGLGYTEQALSMITNPVDIKVLRKAHLYDQQQAKQRNAKPKLKPGDIAPTKKVRAKKSAPQNGLHDNLSAEEWVRRRNLQLAAR